MKIKFESVLKYLVVLMAILCSGTVIFNIKYNSVFIPFWCGFATIVNAVCGEKKGIVKLTNIEMPFFLIVLIVVNTLFHLYEGVELNGVFQIILYIIGTLITCSIFSFDEYKKCFVNCMTVLSVMAVIVFLLVVNGYLGYESQIINGNHFYIALCHVVGWKEYLSQTRVCGLFHEPGMFQILLNIAIFYIADDLLKVDNFKNQFAQIVKFVILTVGIVFTHSTTGYLLLAAIVGVVFFSKRKTIKSSWLAIVYLLLIPVMVFVVWSVLTNDVVVDKFHVNNVSFNTRQKDFFSGLEIVLKAPIMGWGYFSEPYKALLDDYGLVNVSNGLTANMGMFGIIPIIALLVSVFNKRKELTLNIVFVLLFYIMQNATESCLFFPALLAFSFGFRDTKKVDVRKYGRKFKNLE